LLPLPPDDPTRRQPVIDVAKEILGWEPTTDLETGLKKTIDYFRREMPAASRT
jgi:UDP-glucuronate decarboxylase